MAHRNCKKYSSEEKMELEQSLQSVVYAMERLEELFCYMDVSVKVKFAFENKCANGEYTRTGSLWLCQKPDREECSGRGP